MTQTDFSSLSESQYAKKASHYIEILNSLRCLGAHHAVELPTVVFCGNQSAGKSSLLEAISSVQLPRSEGTCTRCVMEIRLMESSEPWKCQIKLRKEYNDENDNELTRPEEFKFGDPIDEKEDVEIMARRAQKALLNPSRNWTEYLNWDFAMDHNEDAKQNEVKFTKNVVCLEIKGPKVPNLSLIDLPGIIRHTENAQDKKFIKLIEDLVQLYIEKEKSIIIATISCKDEIDNQAIVGMAREVDKLGIRTLGVLTKPDTIEDGAESQWLKIMQGEAHKLELGYYVVRNPPPNELKSGITFESARKAEKKYFKQSNLWQNSHFQNRIGVEKLRGKLSELLIKAIERGLPSIKKEIEEQLDQARAELEKLPDPISENSSVEIYRMVKNCASAISEETTCSNKKMALWQKINIELKRFKLELCNTRPIFVVGKSFDNYGVYTPAKFDVLKEFMDPGKSEINKHDDGLTELIEIEQLQEITEADIQHRIEIAKGRLLPGFIPYTAALVLIHDFQKKWKKPADDCLSKIYGIMSELVEYSIQDTFGRFPLLLRIMRRNAMSWLKECKNETSAQLEFNTSMEISQPFSLDERSMSEGKLMYLGALKDAIQNDDNNRQISDNHELIATVMAYFKLSFKRFADTVAMTIIHAFVDEYPRSLEEKLIMPIMEGEDGKRMNFNDLIKEDDSTVEVRKQLSEREKHMCEVLSDLMRFGV